MICALPPARAFIWNADRPTRSTAAITKCARSFSRNRRFSSSGKRKGRSGCSAVPAAGSGRAAPAGDRAVRPWRHKRPSSPHTQAGHSGRAASASAWASAASSVTASASCADTWPGRNASSGSSRHRRRSWSRPIETVPRRSSALSCASGSTRRNPEPQTPTQYSRALRCLGCRPGKMSGTDIPTETPHRAVAGRQRARVYRDVPRTPRTVTKPPGILRNHKNV